MGQVEDQVQAWQVFDAQQIRAGTTQALERSKGHAA